MKIRLLDNYADLKKGDEHNVFSFDGYNYVIYIDANKYDIPYYKAEEVDNINIEKNS